MARVTPVQVDIQAAIFPALAGVEKAQDASESLWGRRRFRIRRRFQQLARSWAYKGTLAAALVFALFGGALWVLTDIPDNPGNDVLDALMCFVTVLFLAEIVVNWIIDRAYPLSFFFFTDMLGTVSMIFEISFLLGPAGKVQDDGVKVNAVLLRTARAAKVGARIGRLSKLVKCLAVFHKRGSLGSNEDIAEVKVLSQRLMLALSSKVSMLTIVVVLAVPLFQIGQYPEQDMSMRVWMLRLEQEYRSAYNDLLVSGRNTTDTFKRATLEMVAFYADNTYRPFRLEGYPEVVQWGRIPGSSVLVRDPPARAQNTLLQELAACRVERPECAGDRRPVLMMDFKVANQTDAATDIAMIVFIVAVMACMSFDLSRTLDAMVLKPLERMLGTVKSAAGDLLQQFGIEEEDDEAATEDEDRGFAEETALLESIFRKLARLADIAARPNVASDEELAEMDEEGKGVVMELMNLKVVQQPSSREKRPSELPQTASLLKWTAGPLGGIGVVKTASEGLPPVVALATLPVAREVIESWDLDVLSLDVQGLQKVVFFILFDSTMGSSTGRTWTSPEKFHRFHTVVRSGYHDLPYHCYAHACDVFHTVFRLLTVTMGNKWLSGIDRYALLIASLCHDLGHMGRTNPFLVETKHELALRYNDKSPLENMHCSRMFEICSKPEANIFDRGDNDTQKQARKVCISAILATDNAQHFDMVREISKVYEMSAELFEQQASESDGGLLPQYEELLQRNPLLWLELFLHLGDVSNPLKTFSVCKPWAWRVLDEFFAQGDEEKRLGLPVGLLNDSERISRPGSQHGFIQFLVAPLVFSSVKLFPPLHPLSTQMASNLASWRDLWVEEAKPTREDTAKRDVDVQKIRETAQQLQRRC